MKSRKYRVIILVALILSVASMTVGYSAFKEELVINSNIFFSGNRWSIRFNNAKLLSLTEDVKEIYVPKLNESAIEISLLFEKENNSAVYSFDIENNGNLDAILSSNPIFEFLPSNYEENVNIKLKYQDGSPVLKGDVLRKNDKRHMILTIDYISSENLASDYSNEVNMKILLIYSQL